MKGSENMAWAVISKIKNAMNEYTFATFPLKNYAGNAGGSYTDINIGGSRQYNDSRESQAYAEGKAVINNILSQGIDCIRGKFSYSASNYTSLDKFIYGDAGGSALRIQITVTNNAQKSFSDMAYRYLNFSSGALNGASGSYGANDNETETYFSAFGLVMNDETEKIYYAEIIMGKSYYRSDHQPAYYDSAGGYIRVWDGLSNSNLWGVFKNSIPGGGGGEVYPTDDFTDPIGGNGDYDDTSDTVENPALPVITANASGFVTAFVPTVGEINALANYMISPSFLQALGQSTLLGGFKDMILGLQVFPCTIPAGTSEQLWLYYPGVAINSGVLMGKATNQFVEIDCGDLEVEEYWGNCCDYNPYTKIGIFLPFCGFYDLDTDDVMGKTLNVSYRVDIMSGACLATIKVDGSVMYQYSGTCSAQIPLNSTSYDEFFKSMIELGTATATGGAGLLAAGASYNTALERSVNMSDKNSYMANAMMDEADAHYDMAKVNAASSLANSTVSNIIGSKAIYKHAGALGSSVGFLGVRKPYLIIKRPYQQIPDMYGKFHGYPCFTKANLNDLTGYTVVDDIRLNIPDATVDEILECEKLLKEGVVL